MLLGYPVRNLGGQNLATLCAAAGKNLAAVGSSHSLTETVNLGTVTAAGLIGTLHGVHLLFLSSAQQSCDRSNTYFPTIQSVYGIIAEKQAKVNNFF